MKRFLAITRAWVLAIPLFLTFVGAASNQAVVAANHDRFPVMVNPTALAARGGADETGQIDLIHCVMTDQTHLNFLADWIDLQTAIYSPGDLLLMLGDYLWQYAPTIWLLLLLTDLYRARHE